MKNSTTSINKLKTKIERKDDSELSKTREPRDHHSKSVKYRLRKQQEREAEELIKEFKDHDTDSDQ